MGFLQSKISQVSVRTPPPNIIVRSVPAPVLGWNARDSFADMDPRFALQLVNWFPDGSNIKLRRGSVDHATGFVGPVEFLHTYAKGTTRKLFAFSDGKVYDVTTGGAIGAPVASGFTSNRWFGANAGANGGETGIYVNGVDPAQQYDGTTWAASGITGPTNPTGITVSKKRVWLIENGTGKAWYGPIEAVTGAFSSFDIGSVVPRGGELIAIGNLTVDGGQGPEDLTIFVMRTGDLVIYAGTDPADAANWALVGVWKAGNPIGERCLVPFDKDLILISDAGFQSILGFTAQGRISGIPISDNISRAVSDASVSLESVYGWHGIYQPHRRQLLFNIPLELNKRSEFYTMNSIYKTWSKFNGWNAIHSEIMGHDLFLGTQDKVIKANEGGIDGSEPIRGTLQTAWNYFLAPGVEKHFKQFRTNIRANTVVDLSFGVGTDFVDPRAFFSSSTEPPSGSPWNTSRWNEAIWASGITTTGDWRNAFATGYNASYLFNTQTRAAEMEFLAMDVSFEPGGVL